MTSAKRLICGGTLVALALVLVACGSSSSSTSAESSSTTGSEATASVSFTNTLEKGLPTSYPEPKSNELTIGLLNPLGANETVKASVEAATAEVERLGGKVIALDANGDPNAQVNQGEQLIAQKVDAIAVPFPLDARALSPVLAQAGKAGIPVVGEDVDVTTAARAPGYDSQVWTRRDETAYLQARAASEDLGKGASIGIIGFAIPVPMFEFGTERTEYWARKFGLNVAGRANNPSDDISGGDQAMTELLGQFSEVEGVIGYNEQSVVGGAAAARAQGITGLTLIGANGGSLGAGAVEDEKITATVQLPYISAAKQMVWGLYDAVSGEKLPPVVVAPEKAILITAENVESVPSFSEEIEQEITK